jgi:hypothetical protein
LLSLASLSWNLPPAPIDAGLHFLLDAGIRRRHAPASCLLDAGI